MARHKTDLPGIDDSQASRAGLDRRSAGGQASPYHPTRLGPMITPRAMNGAPIEGTTP